MKNTNIAKIIVSSVIAFTVAGYIFFTNLEGKKMNDVVVYSGNNCPYCNYAKDLLASKDIKYTEINIHNNREFAKEMIERSGRKSIPQIFIKGEHIGGYDDLKLISDQGKLEPMLEK
jgi:glutaredoxin 3